LYACYSSPPAPQNIATELGSMTPIIDRSEIFVIEMSSQQPEIQIDIYSFMS